MSYNLYSGNGVLGQLASNGGYNELVQFVQRIPGTPELKKFVTDGWTDDIKDLQSEVDGLAKIVWQPDIKSTLQNMSQLLKKAQEVAIVSQ